MDRRFDWKVILLLLAIPLEVFADTGSCIWAGRVYEDQELKINGESCQICNAGKWIDYHVNDCASCKPKRVSDNASHATAKDCTYRKDGQERIFSDGGRIVTEKGDHKICSAGVWLLRDVQNKCPQF